MGAQVLCRPMALDELSDDGYDLVPKMSTKLPDGVQKDIIVEGEGHKTPQR